MSTARTRPPFEPQRVELTKLFDKLPPQAIEAEMGLLGAIILDWKVAGDVLQLLSGAEDFYKPAHGTIYEALVKLYDANQPIDMIQLNQYLTDQGTLEQVGGLDYLVELAESVPSAASAMYYARIVKDKSVLRRLIDVAGKVLFQAYSSADPVQEQLELAEQAIFKIAERRGEQDVAVLKDLLQTLYDQIASRVGQGRVTSGLETGFFDLDEKTSGLQNGELVIVAGRPSMGKTAFAVNIAEHMAIVMQQPVAIFSLEMGKQQLAQRMLCSRSGVHSDKVRGNTLDADDFNKLSMVVGQICDAPLYIDDTPSLSLLQLRAKARRMAAQFDIKALFIDYLQLMSHPGSDSRQQEVSELSRGIKALARELSIPVVCLSQLNRGPEAREGHRPRMSDLRESGAIEQDADVVMMVHREEYYHDVTWQQENPDKVGLAEIIITKQRNGPTGTVELQFNNAITRFQNRLKTDRRQDY